MGGRRAQLAGNRTRTNGKFGEPSLDSLKELIALADQKTEVSLERFFSLVIGFGIERRKHHKLLGEAEEYIHAAYNRFSPENRVRFFAMLYDMFADGYDLHMLTTGHYQAVRRVLGFAAPHIRFPILDITAGTGEPLKYVMESCAAASEVREAAHLLSRADELLAILPGDAAQPGLFFANEISQKMLAEGQKKISGVVFTNHSAYDLPAEYAGKFPTVLCANTFHLVSDEDKTRLVLAIKNALAPEGKAVIIEEYPFRISPTPQIEPISMFLRAVAVPIKQGTLISYFETNGFTDLEEKASAPIDSEHKMWVHIFRKK